MGAPFPAGMAALAPHPRLIPFAWAVNGSLSVLASVATVVVAMPFGFTTLLMVAAAAYALAGWVFPGSAEAYSRTSDFAIPETPSLDRREPFTGG